MTPNLGKVSHSKKKPNFLPSENINKIIEDLNPQQIEAVLYNDNKNVLVMAGAGTGKTTVISRRVAFLLSKSVKPEEILLLTFTRRSALEMKDRIRKFSGNVVDTIEAGTFHNFCLKLIRAMPNAFGINGSTIIDSDDQKILLGSIRTKFIEKGNKSFPKANKIQDWYSYSRNTCCEFLEYLVKEVNSEYENHSVLQKIIAEYEQKKLESGYIDFDDILSIVANKLESNLALRNKLQNVFAECLVDEFQDTNPIQMKILLNLISTKTKLFCVGDDAQSIYSFRGADFKNIHEFVKKIPASVVIPLNINYRSTQKILDISNWVLARSPLNYNKKLHAVKNVNSLKPILGDFYNDFQEADWITDNILKYSEQGYNFKDIMILVRTALCSRKIESALLKRNIPYQFIGGKSTFASAHVKDLMSLVRIVSNHSDEIAWLRYLQLFPGIGEVSANKFLNKLFNEEKITAYSLQFILKNNPSVIDIVLTVEDVIKNPCLCLETAVKKLEPILSEKYSSDKWHSRKQDLNLLIMLAKDFSSIHEFLDTYSLDPQAGINKKSENDDCVTLITIHSAKGSEAKICFLAQAQSGMFPSMRSLGNFEREEEERRCLYVAMTRAKHILNISRSNDSNSFKGSFSKTVGAKGEEYFLESLPNNLVDHTTKKFSGFGLSSLKDIY